jgi:phosphopentomutase
MRPSRVILIVLDSAGAGELPDASVYGDAGSDTLGNIARARPLALPTLRSLGLAEVAAIGGPRPSPRGAVGRLAERSAGKDSVTGHWELMGIVLPQAFPTFPHGFPADLMAEFERRIGRGSLCNRPASGTVVLEEFGPAHLRTGKPIVYTSADSVFQIAAHEDVIAVPELYKICGVAFDLAGRGLGVGRVIARPFVGTEGHFTRTANRRDFALEPFGTTLLDRLEAAGHPVVGIGKIDDLFGGRGLTKAIHTTSDADGLDRIEAEMAETTSGLIFTNLVDSDTLYGHRNDVAGYADNLERIDARLARIVESLAPTDLLVITADHGNDPTTPSTDHSREHVPVLLAGPGVRAGVNLGRRDTFADLGQTLADLFGVAPLDHGTSFLSTVLSESDAYTSRHVHS